MKKVGNEGGVAAIGLQERGLYGSLILPQIRMTSRGFPGGAVVKNPPANAGDTGSSPAPGRSHMPRSN